MSFVTICSIAHNNNKKYRSFTAMNQVLIGVMSKRLHVFRSLATDSNSNNKNNRARTIANDNRILSCYYVYENSLLRVY